MRRITRLEIFEGFNFYAHEVEKKFITFWHLYICTICWLLIPQNNNHFKMQLNLIYVKRSHTQMSLRYLQHRGWNALAALVSWYLDKVWPLQLLPLSQTSLSSARSPWNGDNGRYGLISNHIFLSGIQGKLRVTFPAPDH